MEFLDQNEHNETSNQEQLLENPPVEAEDSHEVSHDGTTVEDPVDVQSNNHLDYNSNDTNHVNGEDHEHYDLSNGVDHLEVSTPSKGSQRGSDGSQEPPRSAERTGRSKIYSPSDSLARSTKARICDQLMLENSRKAKDPPKVKIPPAGYQPSERLLRTTQARIADTKEWEAAKDRVNYDDDIWWELRRPAPCAHTKNEVSSKLMEPTTAFKQSIRKKKDEAEKEKIVSPHKETININPASPLLKTTRTSIGHSWKAEQPAAEPAPSLVLLGAQSGPQVQSKVMEETVATIHSRWVPKSQEVQEVVAPATKFAKPPSERLLAYNAAMRHQARDKAVKDLGDPRERGWDVRNIGRETIPTIDEVFAVPQRRNSRSPTRRSLSQSQSQSISSKGSNDYHLMDDAVANYTDHAGEDAMHPLHEQALQALQREESQFVQHEEHAIEQHEEHAVEQHEEHEVIHNEPVAVEPVEQEPVQQQDQPEAPKHEEKEIVQAPEDAVPESN
eukprot:gene1843-2016_t